MNLMIEQVAKAIATENLGREMVTPGDLHRRLARAAIAAMREPTPKMIDAGDEAQTENGEPVALSAIVPWQAMIDAALK